jgi:glutamine synthetase
MAHSLHAPRLLGARFVQAYLAVKALEHQNYLAEVSAWERRFLLPQV